MWIGCLGVEQNKNIVLTSQAGSTIILLFQTDAPGAPLEGLEEIEVSIVSDRTIAAVHKRFMDIAGATDVITFEHGEIVISAQTAGRYAEEYGQPLEHELGLYIIHGILHLNGHDDLEEPAASRMKAAQGEILGRVLGIFAAR